jgi:hypothetical protein
LKSSSAFALIFYHIPVSYIHWSVRQTQQFANNIRANPSKITQSVLKEFLCVGIKSPDGCFYEKYAKMHERNIARPRMPICRVKKISDHTKCWSGESPHCWAAVSRAPEFRPEFHDVIAMQECGATSDRWHRRHRSCVIHCLLRHGILIWILML